MMTEEVITMVVVSVSTSPSCIVYIQYTFFFLVIKINKEKRVDKNPSSLSLIKVAEVE